MSLEKASEWSELAKKFRYMLIRISEGMDSMTASNLAFAEFLPESVTDPKACIPQEMSLRVLKTLQERGRFNPTDTAGLEEILKELNKNHLLREVEEYKQLPLYQQLTKKDRKEKTKGKKKADIESGNGGRKEQDFYILTQSHAVSFLEHLETLQRATSDSPHYQDEPNKKSKALQTLTESEEMLKKIKALLKDYRKEFQLAPSGKSDSSIEDNDSPAQSPCTPRKVRNGSMTENINRSAEALSPSTVYRLRSGSITEKISTSVQETGSPASSPQVVRKKPKPTPRRRMSESPGSQSPTQPKKNTAAMDAIFQEFTSLKTPVPATHTYSPLEHAVTVQSQGNEEDKEESTGTGDSGYEDIEEWRAGRQAAADARAQWGRT